VSTLFVFKCVLYYCHRVSTLFVCKCVLYYCHRVSTQLPLNISYHIISYHIISIALQLRKKSRKTLNQDSRGMPVCTMKRLARFFLATSRNAERLFCIIKYCLPQYLLTVYLKPDYDLNYIETCRVVQRDVLILIVILLFRAVVYTE
jgi:hypothetical protein